MKYTLVRIELGTVKGEKKESVIKNYENGNLIWNKESSGLFNDKNDLEFWNNLTVDKIIEMKKKIDDNKL